MEVKQGAMLLIIERDRKFSAKLKQHLNIPGLRNFFVETAQDATFLLKSMSAQFILADLNAFNSKDELAELESYAKTHHLPLLLILGYKNTETLTEYVLEKGSFSVIRLPFGLKDLVNRIQGLRTAQDPLIGQTLGPAGQEVKIIRKIGAGAMGSVYEGFQESLDRVVAVKFLSTREQEIDGEAAERFTQEAKAMAQMRSPNIVQIYFVGRHEQRPYIVMEYVNGPNLEKYLRAKRSLNIKEALDITRQVLLGMDHAHRRGKIHRDLKPANIMLTKEGQAVVLDFGLVRGAGSANLTAAGTVIGTPRYISPEQVSGKDLDHRCDIYSLGIILYEMLLGQPPFKGTDFVSLVTKHLQEPLPPPETIGRELDPRLFQIISTFAAKSPDNRFQSAMEAIQALEAYLGSIGETQITTKMGSTTRSVMYRLQPRGGLAINDSGVVVSHFGDVPPERAQSLHIVNSLLTQLNDIEDQGHFERGLLNLENSKMVIFSAHEGLAGIESDWEDITSQFSRMTLNDLNQYFRQGLKP